MGARSVAREAALMLMFGAEAAKPEELDGALAHFWVTFVNDAGLEVDLESRKYAEELFRGATADLVAIDALIRKASANWRLERMSRVDRNVLRLGAYELKHAIPRAIAIDEAVELGKRFGSEESAAFVNGVLERVATDLGAA